MKVKEHQLWYEYSDDELNKYYIEFIQQYLYCYAHIFGRFCERDTTIKFQPNSEKYFDSKHNRTTL